MLLLLLLVVFIHLNQIALFYIFLFGFPANSNQMMAADSIQWLASTWSPPPPVGVDSKVQLKLGHHCEL